MNNDRIAKLAFNVITNFMNLKEENVISIFTEIYDNETYKFPHCELNVTEEIAIALRKRDAFPILEITTENLQRRFFEEVPEDLIKSIPEYFEKRINDIDIFLEIGWKALKNPYYNIDSNARLLYENIYKLLDKLRIKNKKIIFINYPSEELAKQINFDYEKLLNIYFSAVNCDYKNLNKIAEELNFFLQTTETLNIETIVGKLKLLFDNKNVKIFNNFSDNILILPLGKAEIPIKRAFLNGDFFAENVYYKNLVYHNVEVSFKDGFITCVKLKDSTSRENFDLKNNLIGARKEAFLSIGFNPNNKTYSNYYSYDRTIYNAVSLKFYDIKSNPILLINKNNKNNIKGL